MIGVRLPALLLAVAVGVGAVAGISGLASGSGAVTREVTIHYSRFEQVSLTVPRGVPVTFVLVNRDPIEHEWLIGDEAFHEQHRQGTEAEHGARPAEVSIPPLGRAQTTITFDQPGVYAYICHLPGHEAYGMVGTLTVT